MIINIKDVVYWKCFVISPGSEISLGIDVIMRVLATCKRQIETTVSYFESQSNTNCFEPCRNAVFQSLDGKMNKELESKQH